MQTSGTAPQFSDGVKKQIVGGKAPAPRATKAPMTPAPAGPKNTHMRGGFAKHSKGGK